MRPEEQVLHPDILFDRIRVAVEGTLPVPGQVKHRLAQRLARYRAGVDAHATDDVCPLDDGDPLVDLGSLDRSPLPRRARADH